MSEFGGAKLARCMDAQVVDIFVTIFDCEQAFPGTAQCVTRHVKDMLTSMGGIRGMFPLFAQLDQPLFCPRPLSPISSKQSILPEAEHLSVSSQKNVYKVTSRLVLFCFCYFINSC